MILWDVQYGLTVDPLRVSAILGCFTDDHFYGGRKKLSKRCELVCDGVRYTVSEPHKEVRRQWLAHLALARADEKEVPVRVRSQYESTGPR